MDEMHCPNCNKVTTHTIKVADDEDKQDYNWERCEECNWAFVGKAWLKKWKIL